MQLICVFPENHDGSDEGLVSEKYEPGELF